MENRRNYYRILHIQPDAPDAIIKASYRTQMQKLKMHPDLGGDEWNASLLNEAFQTLSDPDRRRAYDKDYFGDRGKLRKTVQSRAGSTHQQARANPGDDAYPPDPSTCPFCKTAKPAVSITIGPGNCPGCDAPLEVANTLRLADTSKRAVERISHHAPVQIFLTPGYSGRQGTVRDLSPNGLQLLCSFPLHTGQILRIASAALSATGRVTFCNRAISGEQFIAGLEFLTLRFHERTGTFISVSA